MSNESHLFDPAPDAQPQVSIAPPDAPLPMPRQELEAPVRRGFTRLARWMHIGGRTA